MNENPVLFWLLWLLLQPKKTQDYAIHVIFTRMYAPSGFGGTVGNPPLNGIKYEYRKYLVAKFYRVYSGADDPEYLGWFTLATYNSSWGFCTYYNDNGAEYIETRPIGSDEYQVVTTVNTINSISAEYASNYAIQMHQKWDSVVYNSDGSVVDESHDEYNFSTTFNFDPVEQTLGDENIKGGTVNVFGDGMTLEKYKKIYEELQSAEFTYSND